MYNCSRVHVSLYTIPVTMTPRQRLNMVQLMVWLSNLEGADVTISYDTGTKSTGTGY